LIRFFEILVERLIEYFKGNYKKPKRPLEINSLKMAYVGLTRPTHLLCVAAHEKSVFGNETDLERAGWELIPLSSSKHNLNAQSNWDHWY